MEKVDFKKQLKHIYNPTAKEVSIVNVPAMNFLMINGRGNPKTSKLYKSAIEALFAVSYALKCMIKKSDLAIDYKVMPLEGLWWVEDMTQFSFDNKDAWLWTAMMMQPEYVTKELVEEAKRQVDKKKGLSNLTMMRFESFHEGQVVQIMHIGPYTTEPETIQRMKNFIKENDFIENGKHHEIYLSDPRKAAPEKMKTIIRQPVK